MPDVHSPTTNDAAHKVPGGRGWFCLSFDFELAWGIAGERGWHSYRRRLHRAAEVIGRICDLLDAYKVSATWATVGAIMLDSADDPLVQHALSEHAAHPRRTAILDGIAECPDYWFRPDLVRRILGASTPQEIGSHSFSHRHFDERELGSDHAKQELEAAVAAASRLGRTLTSFVFPCNIEGHHRTLRDAGFACYRGGGDGSSGGALARRKGTLGRAVRLLDQTWGMRPMPVWPTYRAAWGLWDVPASAFLMPMTGVRGLGGRAARRRKTLAGLEQAVTTGGVFHLWSHPHNFMADTDRMIDILEVVVEAAADLRDRGDLVIAPMGAVEKVVGGTPA